MTMTTDLDPPHPHHQPADHRRVPDAMMACLRVLAGDSGPATLLQALLEEIRRAFDADTAFMLSGGRGDPLRLTVIASDRIATVGRCWRHGEPFARLDAERPIACIDDVAQAEGWQGQDAGTPVASAIHVAIGALERPAFLVCGSGRHDHFGTDHVALAAALAPIAAQALARAEEHRRLQGEIAEHIRIAGELRLTQGRMVQLQKMEAVSRLAAGLAHEINTPVQFVSDNLRFLDTSVNGLVNLVNTLAGWLAPHMDRAVLDQFLEAADLNYLQQEVPKAFLHCQEGLDRVGNIIHTLKLFAEAGSDAIAPADINDAIRTTLAVCMGGYRGSAAVTIALGELPPVPCRIGEIKQVLHSLLLNAVQAIDEHGGQGTIAITTGLNDGQAELVIADDGCGMDAEVLRRACDPFFTTKPLGTGTGQGLSIAHEVVRRHGGELLIESRPGTGTRITLRLPVAATVLIDPPH